MTLSSICICAHDTGLANALSPPAAHKQGKPPAGPATPNISSVATYTASTPSYDMTTTSPAPVKANKATTPSTVNTATNHGSSSSSSTRASLISVGVGTSPFPQPALQHAIVGLPATPASCCSSMAGGPASPASKADTPARQHEERELPPRVLLAHASNSGSGGGGSYCASLASEGAGGCGGGGVGERGPPQDLFESAAADRPMAKSGAVKERRPTGSGVLRQRVWKDVWLVLDADFLRVYKSKVGSSLLTV